MKRQLDELTRISHRQAKFILDLEAENANLRALAIQRGLGVPGAILSPRASDRDRDSESDEAREEEKRKEPVAYVDGLGNDLEFNE